ncbi:MAG: DNA starvation/stationary phase protection protein [Chlamydiia bacterium]|nr:DNA starvation/stationary phase protection protein [Chlamydiia bacterium]
MKNNKTLDDKTVDEICEKLATFVSDTFVLYVKTLNFHWNMKGPQFFMYHRLLEEQYKEMAKATDELSEQIRLLDRYAPGSMHEFLQKTSLKEANTLPNQNAMIKELASDHDALVEKLHGAIKFMDTVLDQGTSDLLIERIRFHSKASWLLRSSLA